MSPKRDDFIDDEPWIKHFELSCSIDLSMEEMRRMTTDVAEDDLKDLKGSPFLHIVCSDKNVTLEIVEYLLELYPQAIHTFVAEETDEIIGDYIESAYPLHLACYNYDCPNEVIDLLLRKETNYQLTQICIMHNDWGDMGYDNDYGGTPLHYYLSRALKNIDLDIVKRLVANPRALSLTDDVGKYTPIHILLRNESIGDMSDVLRFLVETNPSSLQIKDRCDETPLYIACRNRRMKAETIKLLLKAGVGVVYERNEYGEMPLHCLCSCGIYQTFQMDDEVAMDILKLLLDAHPEWTSIETDEVETDGGLPLHKAAANKSLAFCKLLVGAYPEAVKEVDGRGCLPFHKACDDGRLETVEYLFGLYPESLHIRDDWGHLPIHCAANSTRRRNGADIIKFLLRHDPECLSRPVVTDRRHHLIHENGCLPLHIVCSAPSDKDNSTELLYDLYPEAILIRNGQGQLPVDIIREKLDQSSSHIHGIDRKQRRQDLIPFLYTQMSYATKAQNESAMRRRDRTGSLPLHNAIRSDAPLGSIKLLVKGNHDAINVPDGYGVHPLDIACQFCTVGVIKYLAELIGNDRLNACDVNKNYPLHHACRGGNCEVIEYLLERPMSSASVSERNVDEMLPIHLFCEFVKGRWCEGETPEYTGTIWCLLTAYPETVLNW